MGQATRKRVHMTRKDYVLIAETVRDNVPLHARSKVALAFSVKLQRENARFDSVKFFNLATSTPQEDSDTF